MDNTTEQQIASLYDQAYQQGFIHATKLCEKCVNLGIADIAGTLKEFISKKYPELKVEETLNQLT